ncbi:MAG TPA: DUF2235 domain-containing protein [Steroidobacteraceae bacterium]
MARNLVLCLDGTSNRYKRDNTNVLKLFAMLDRSRVDQIVYYQPGIGTITPIGETSRVRRWFLRLIDLAFGVLLKQHCLGAYRFLMQTYQPGDRIYIFGFSRGAYTARVLAGMVQAVGLLPPNNDEMLDFAWKLYKKAPRDPAQWKLINGFRKIFSVGPRRPTIELLGLWDTVSSVRYLWRNLTFQYTRDNPSVAHVRHAVALDERRAYFRQNLWSPRAQKQDVVEVWFPGAHCDVGGGYLAGECGLSNLALRWMLDEAMSLANPVHFDDQAIKRYLPAQAGVGESGGDDEPDGIVCADSCAKAHESLKWYWWPIELIPKSYQHESADGTYHTRWMIPFGRRRFLLNGVKVHRSVKERIDKGMFDRRLLPETVDFV